MFRNNLRQRKFFDRSINNENNRNGHIKYLSLITINNLY